MLVGVIGEVRDKSVLLLLLLLFIVSICCCSISGFELYGEMQGDPFARSVGNGVSVPSVVSSAPAPAVVSAQGRPLPQV